MNFILAIQYFCIESHQFLRNRINLLDVIYRKKGCESIQSGFYKGKETQLVGATTTVASEDLRLALSQHGFVEQRNTSDPIGNGDYIAQEGGCLYRIKIGRYHSSASRDAPATAASAAAAIVPQLDSRCMSSVTIVPFVLSFPLQPFSFSLSLFLFVLYSSEFYFHSIPGSVAHCSEGITQVVGGEKETRTRRQSKNRGDRGREVGGYPEQNEERQLGQWGTIKHPSDLILCNTE